MVLEVERRQHGFPSGIDHQTVLRGGVVWARSGPERGHAQLDALSLAEWSQPTIIDTGAPDQSTGEVVEEVRRRVGGDSYPGWQMMHEATTEFRRCLESGADPVSPVRVYQSELERLGVVPTRVAEWIRTWEDGGGAAKISGAGATRGDRAGCLLAYPLPDGTAAQEFGLPEGWRVYNPTIGGRGLDIDSV